MICLGTAASAPNRARDEFRVKSSAVHPNDLSRQFLFMRLVSFIIAFLSLQSGVSVESPHAHPRHLFRVEPSAPFRQTSESTMRRVFRRNRAPARPHPETSNRTRPGPP